MLHPDKHIYTITHSKQTMQASFSNEVYSLVNMSHVFDGLKKQAFLKMCVLHIHDAPGQNKAFYCICTVNKDHQQSKISVDHCICLFHLLNVKSSGLFSVVDEYSDKCN